MLCVGDTKCGIYKPKLGIYTPRGMGRGTLVHSLGSMNMLMLLQKEFKIEDLILVRKRLGKSGDMQSAKAQLFTWRTRRLVDFDDINGIIKNLSRKTKT